MSKFVRTYKNKTTVYFFIYTYETHRVVNENKLVENVSNRFSDRELFLWAALIQDYPFANRSHALDKTTVRMIAT